MLLLVLMLMLLLMLLLLLLVLLLGGRVDEKNSPMSLRGETQQARDTLTDMAGGGGRLRPDGPGARSGQS